MKSTTAFTIGRISLTLSFLALVAAWLGGEDGTIAFSQSHLFSDAIVFALLGIGMLIDGLVHRKEEGKM